MYHFQKKKFQGILQKKLLNGSLKINQCNWNFFKTIFHASLDEEIVTNVSKFKVI